jgi:hypothetical protein
VSFSRAFFFFNTLFQMASKHQDWGRGKHGLEGETLACQSKYGLCLNTNGFDLTAQFDEENYFILKTSQITSRLCISGKFEEIPYKHKRAFL